MIIHDRVSLMRMDTKRLTFLTKDILAIALERQVFTLALQLLLEDGTEQLAPFAYQRELALAMERLGWQKNS